MVCLSKTNLPPMPKFLEYQLKNIFYNIVRDSSKLLSYHYNTDLLDNIQYTLNDNHKNSGGIDIYHVIDNELALLRNFYKLPTGMFYYQYINTGNFVAPHYDESREHSYMYFLDTGGDNVITSWWDIKDEFKSLYIPEVTPIPETLLNLRESHVMECGQWYEFTHSIIHSVDNIERPRLSIVYLKD